MALVLVFIAFAVGNCRISSAGGKADGIELGLHGYALIGMSVLILQYGLSINFLSVNGVLSSFQWIWSALANQIQFWFTANGHLFHNLFFEHAIFNSISCIYVAWFAWKTISTKHSLNIRTAGKWLSIFLVMTLFWGTLLAYNIVHNYQFSTVVQVIHTLHVGFTALLVLPLLAISFYARYAVLEPEQTYTTPALEQKGSVVLPKAVAVPTVEQYVEAEPASLLLRLKTQLKKTRSGLGNVLASVNIGQRKIDADLLEEIESSLIMADIGMDATTDIIKRLTEKTERQQLSNAEALTAALKQELLEMLEAFSRPLVVPKQDTPYVILVVGINGAGKTTTIGKIAKRLQAQGHSVMLAAGDTFRAAAVEQLQVWGDAIIFMWWRSILALIQLRLFMMVYSRHWQKVSMY